MAYRIRYGQITGKGRRGFSLLPAQTLWAGALLCLILLGSLVSEAWRGWAEEIFIPGQELSCFQAYAQGESIRQILIRQCRGVLIGAGYEG